MFTSRPTKIPSTIITIISTNMAGVIHICTWTDGTANMVKIRNSARGMNNPSTLRRESTISRAKARTGPLSRGSRYASSPAIIFSRLSAMRARRSAFSTLRSARESLGPRRALRR
ncbi:Uncharacterised protein [Mycobacteroides abscessus subsp. abscessus]|nr:Uncharacterised protein [Mycobacteroides abscessus subsp. abscessus]